MTIISSNYYIISFDLLLEECIHPLCVNNNINFKGKKWHYLFNTSRS